MKPLSYARRAAQWLMAAGIALAAMPAASAPAQAAPELNIQGGVLPHPEHGALTPFFTKTGAQRDCDTVVYTLRFGLKGDPQALNDPTLAAKLSALRLDFTDTLPAGLKILSVNVTGDGTDAVGGPLPTPAVSTAVNPDDTARIANFRLSANDLDGMGGAGERAISISIVAKIDHAAFPAPAVVANQAFVKAAMAGGPSVQIPSHDPSLPDDADILTGAPTKIRIDVTRCDPPPPPPPPPGDKACFKVEKGDVDCVPGGGAFIYHLPVGPEMAGKWVQLGATNPGVTIAPPARLVPPGGGVLSFTITGAGPGDVVHLVVTGIETYGDDHEGVNICCTQTIDLVIPRDIRCPPKDREPDLKVEKKADAAFCRPEGPCPFTITVTNVGTGPYNGPIVLNEVTAPGNAAVVSGPNAPWTCAPMTSPMACTHPATTLNPGASVQLTLGFAPGADWNGRTLRNCAAYNYDASGKKLFGKQNNDKACASIQICRRGDRDCQPPVEKKADLRITKVPRSEICSADGLCSFLVRVFNNGTATYAGPLTVTDNYPTGAPSSSTFGPTPPWTCGPAGPGQFTCQHPGVVLVPGASVPLSVIATVPADYRSDVVRNCAAVDAIANETDLTNNRACADMRVRKDRPQQPGLVVEKTGDKECRVGQPCTFEITITNPGTAVFSGPVRIGDAIGIDGSGRLDGVPISEISPPFGCSPEPSTLPMSCVTNVTLAPGEQHVHMVTVVIPDTGGFANGPVGAQNCVGVVPPDRPVTRAGANITAAPVAGGDDRGAYACHRFTISRPEKPQCSAGFVLNQAGRCVCPEGTTFRNGQCAPVKTGNPVKPQEPQQCKLLPGQIRTQSGDCVCSLGTELVNRQCVDITPPPVRLCKLLPGQIRTQAGDCVCPRGTQLVNRQCVDITPPPVRQCKLLPGQIRTQAGDCVCPRGTELVNRQCVDITPPPVRQCKLLPGQIRTQAGDCVCPRGTELVNRQCVDITPPPVRQCKLLPGQIRTQSGDCVCPRGTQLVNRQCVDITPPPVRQCKLLPGQIRTQSGDCICPRGTSLVRGQCVDNEPPPVRQCKLLPGQIRTPSGECVCPRGTSLVRGQCVKRPTEVQCPKGQVMRNGECVTILRQRQPTLQIDPGVVNPDLLRKVLPRGGNDQQEGDPNRKAQ